MKAKTTTTEHPIKAIRRAAVPLVAIETADPRATMEDTAKALNGKADETPIVLWDACNGLTGINPKGEEYAQEVGGEPGGERYMKTGNPVEALKLVANTAPKKLLAFMANAHLCLTQAGQPNLGVIQAVWNCRDPFKSRGATLVLLAPGLKLPAELASDVVTVSEEAPTEEDIGRTIDSLNRDAGIDAGKVDRAKAIDGLLGYLSAFAVEQSYAISLTPEGPDYRKLWELKVQSMKQTAGLEVSMPELTFTDLVGSDGVKTVLRRHLNGKTPPRAVLWLDEIEKMLAASSTDLSGTTQAMLEQFLYWTQSRRVKGFLLAGIPGAGKSLTCQAVAGEAKCPLLRASMSTVKGGLVGESEANMSRLLKSVDAVAQGRVLMLATCNSLDALSPEVMGRFNMGMFFYDYPTDKERAAIWAHYKAKFTVDGEPPRAKNWVGREIEACCEKADNWQIPLTEAAETVIPAATANAVKLQALRQQVSGRFLSAERPGLYRAENPNTVSSGAGGRSMEVS